MGQGEGAWGLHWTQRRGLLGLGEPRQEPGASHNRQALVIMATNSSSLSMEALRPL